MSNYEKNIRFLFGLPFWTVFILWLADYSVIAGYKIEVLLGFSFMLIPVANLFLPDNDTEGEDP